MARRTEVPLAVYQALQTPRNQDEGLLLRVLKGIATRDYEACAEAVPEAFGLSRSSVSRRYVKSTARKLAQFQERSLEGYDLVALFLDGKSFADEEILNRLGRHCGRQEDSPGLRAGGHRERAGLSPLPVRVGRARLQYEAACLVVLDGARVVQGGAVGAEGACLACSACPYHKRRNVCSYLSKNEQARIRRKMETAYGQPTYEEAKAALEALKPGLELMNQSALRSLEEGLEETLTLHRFGTDAMLKDSFRNHQLHRERQTGSWSS